MTLYEISFDEQLDDGDFLQATPLMVLANGDASEAIAKARRSRLGKIERWTDESEGKKYKAKVTGFALRGVKVIADVDIS